jgi:hypothetical protein
VKVTFAYQFTRVTAINHPNFPANNVTYTYGAGTKDRSTGRSARSSRRDPGDPDPGNQIQTYVTRSATGTA